MFRTRCSRCATRIIADDVVLVGLPESHLRDKYIDSFRTGTARYVDDGGNALCDSCQNALHQQFIYKVLHALDLDCFD